MPSLDIPLTEIGSPSGTPLVFFHGFPGSHVQGKLLAAGAEKYNLRVLSVDRPGYADSSQSTKGLADFATRLIHTLDRRGIEKTYLLGVSGGNPGAMTTAARLGSRVLALGSICGLAPFAEAPEIFSPGQRKSLNLVRTLPRPILRATVATLIKRLRPEERVDTMVERFSLEDRRAINGASGMREMLRDSLHLSLKQGAAGVVFDLKTFVEPWPFAWGDLRCPVRIWHGQRDTILHPSMAEFLGRKIPQARVRYFPEDGHYSLPLEHGDELLRDLISG